MCDFRWELRIVDIRDNARHAQKFIDGMTYEDFKDDTKTIFTRTYSTH